MEVRLEDCSEGCADRLPEVHRALVYRIVQEAVNNAVQHSEATRLTVRLSCCGDILEIMVEDDGRGGVDPHSSRGVSHMRSRSALVGGQVSFGKGERGRGTRVAIRVPLHDAYRALPQ